VSCLRAAEEQNIGGCGRFYKQTNPTGFFWCRPGVVFWYRGDHEGEPGEGPRSCANSLAPGAVRASPRRGGRQNDLVVAHADLGGVQTTQAG